MTSQFTSLTEEHVTRMLAKTLADNGLLVEDLCKVPYESIISIAKKMNASINPFV
mgnify:CR=1 FL=1